GSAGERHPQPVTLRRSISDGRAACHDAGDRSRLRVGSDFDIFAWSNGRSSGAIGEATTYIPDSNLTYAWNQQRIWSQTANRLKRGINTARRAALVLGIAAAVLAVAAVQAAGISSGGGRVLGLLVGVPSG